MSTEPPCAVKKLRVLSFEDLRDKVTTSFDQGLGDTDVVQQQLSDLSVSSSSSTAIPSLASPQFTLYYLLDRTRWWESRVKVDDEDSFEEFVSRPPYLRPTLLVWRTPADCNLAEHQQLHASQHHHSPLKDGAPPQHLDSLTLPPSGVAGSVLSPTKSIASSRSSAQQADFSDAVRARDDDKCVVCTAEQVEAAHVVPVKDNRTAAGKAAAQLLTLYDPRNGLTLCTHCHDYFDAGLWFLSPVDRCSIEVSDALVTHRPEWLQRRNTKARLPTHHIDVDNWPSKRTLQVQVDFVIARKQQRLEERRSYPQCCRPCGARFMTKDGLTHHGRYCTGRGHLKPSQFHTPQKLSKVVAAAVPAAAVAASPVSQHRQQRSSRRAREAKTGEKDILMPLPAASSSSIPPGGSLSSSVSTTAIVNAAPPPNAQPFTRQRSKNGNGP